MRVCVCVRACVHVGVRVSLCVWLGAGVCIRYDAATDAFPVQEAVGKRLQALQGVLAHWRRGDVTSALRCVCDAEDEMVVCGFLDSSSRHTDIWTIDSVQLILPAVVRLLQSSSEDVVVIALQTCQMLVRLFGQVIQEVRAAPRPSPAGRRPARPASCPCSALFGSGDGRCAPAAAVPHALVYLAKLARQHCSVGTAQSTRPLTAGSGTRGVHVFQAAV